MHNKYIYFMYFSSALAYTPTQTDPAPTPEPSPIVCHIPFTPIPVPPASNGVRKMKWFW